MLIYTRERLLPANINMIVLTDNDGGYYYLHRSLYEQAVIVEDRYKEHIDDLIRALGSDPDVTRPTCVSYFVAKAPRPINILGYYLHLIDNVYQLDDLSMETLCGAIHVMSSVLNFREFLKIPKEARAGVSFSLSIREEYEVSWDRFFQEAIPYSSISTNNVTHYQPQKSVATTTSGEELTLENAETEEDFLALLDEDFEIELPSMDDEDEEEVVAETPAPEPVIEEPKKPSGLSLLGGM